MNKFSFDLLNKLIKNYYNSKLSKGGSTRNLKIKLTTNDAELSSYTGRDSFKYIEDNDAELACLEKKGYIIVHRDYNNQLQSVELVISAKDEIIKAIGFEDRDAKLDSILQILQTATDSKIVQTFVDSEVAYIKDKFCWHKSFFNDEKELSAILRVLNAMSRQTEEIMERDFSVQILNDSKAFGILKSKIIKILKKFDELLVLTEDETDEEILLNYNIVKNSTYALVKGELNFKLNNQLIELKKLGFEYSLSDAMIKQIELLPSNISKLITVENLTTFYKINEETAVVVFLSGFHNHTKQMFLKKIYKYFNKLECYHFGDIDVGGFLIYNNLVGSTGIPFEPYKMGVAELVAHRDNLKTLTENDRARLADMLTKKEYEIFHTAISYMLENNVKLEQEILD